MAFLPEYGELDPYEYWMDIEYNDDVYYDNEGTYYEDNTMAKVGGKRKRSGSSSDQPSKRRKGASGIDDKVDVWYNQENVIWRPLAETFKFKDEGKLEKKPMSSFALLKDWRDRLNKSDEGERNSIPELPAAKDADEDEEGSEWEDEAMEEGVAEGDEEGEGLAIDPEMLKSALAAKFSALGRGIDHGALIQSLMQMISGGEDVNIDEIVGELTNSVLDQASKGGADSEVSQWLSQQGVSLPEDEEENEEETEQSVKDEPSKTLAAKSPKQSDNSPRDSAVSVGSSQGKTRVLPTRTSPASKLGKANVVEKTVSSTAAEPAKRELHTVADPTAATPRRLSHVLVPSHPSSPEKLVPATTPATAKKLKRVSFAPSVNNTEAQDESIPESQPEHEETQEKAPSKAPSAAKAKAASTAKQSRKRKASTDETAPAPEPQKRQLRSFAAPTAASKGKAKAVEPMKKEPAKRVTRSSKK